MNKIGRMILLPLTVAVGAAGLVKGFIIYNKLARVKLADAAIREMEEKKAGVEGEQGAPEAENCICDCDDSDS